MTSKNITNKLLGSFAMLALVVSTVCVFIPFFIISVLKVYPSAAWRVLCTKSLHAITTAWTHFNNSFIDLTRPARFEINGIEKINPNDWYLIVANHQSWLDIVVLQYVFNRTIRLPVLIFFIKDQLKWVPVLGFCWWAMGYPFMKRHSKEYLERKPHKKGQDLRATIKAINKFKKLPGSLVSFVEGTRFTATKNRQQQAPYEHLLKPKAGGISFVIGAMHKEIDSLLDITIVYPNETPSIWDFLCHQIDVIKVEIRQILIPAKFRNPILTEDTDLQTEFRLWINEQWLEKDHLMSQMKDNHGKTVRYHSKTTE